MLFWRTFYSWLEQEDYKGAQRVKEHIGRWTENDKKNLGELKAICNTKTTIPMYNFTSFYLSKMAVAIAFLCQNAVEAI